MIRKLTLLFLFSTLLVIAVACSRKDSAVPQLQVEIPGGFSGNFVLEMGVHGAPPLQKSGEGYFVAVPRNGTMETSTLLDKPHVIFKNSSDGKIWGYSQSVFTTGDGISVGGKIEFFVGTQKDFEAEQNRKNKAGGFPAVEPVIS